MIFIYSLARRVNDRVLALGLRPETSEGTVTLRFIGLALCERLPDPFWLLSVLMGVALVPLQNEVARINSARDVPLGQQAKFSGLNIGWLIIGGLLWLLVLAGLILPEIE